MHLLIRTADQRVRRNASRNLTCHFKLLRSEQCILVKLGMKIDKRNTLEQEMLGNWVDIAVAGQELRLLGDLSRALRNRWKLLALAAIFGAVMGGLLSFQRDETFDATAQVMINTQILVETSFTPVESGQPISTTVLESEIEVLRSLDLVEKVVDRFNLVDDVEFNADAAPTGETTNAPETLSDQPTETTSTSINGNPPFDALREEIIATVAEKRTVNQVGNISAVYAITFNSKDPRKAAVLANALAEEYISASRDARIKTLELSQGWLQSRTEDLKLRLSTLSVQREQFLLSAPYSPEEVETIKARNISDSRQISATRQEIETLRADIAIMRDILTWGDIITRASAAQNTLPEMAQAIIIASENPQTARTQLRKIIASLIDQRDLQKSAIETAIKESESEIASSSAILVEQATRDAELSRIENDIVVAEAIYQDFVSQLTRRTQQDSYLDDDARIISSARPALDASEPNRQLYVIVASVLATIAAFITIIVSEIRQSKLRNRTEFELATDLPLLGIVPEIKDLPAQLQILHSGVGTLDPFLMEFARKLRVSVLAETMRRHKFQASRTDKHPMQVIAGVAACPDEGQSSALIALTVALAEANEFVLYVSFSDVDKSGAGSAIPRSVTPAPSSTSPRLSFLHINLSAQNKNETRIILEFKKQLDELRLTYDRIILDAPAILSRSCSTQICQYADEIVQIGRWNHTSKGEIRSALQTLSDADVTPIGVIATRFDLTQAKRYGDNTVYIQRAIPAHR
jgi:succinoglycan biosynthesis transport protein ExoP